MPDLKSEMSKVLEAWDQEEQQPQEKQVQTQREMPQNIFQPTNNVTKETFNYVRDNPNKTSVEVCTALEARGFRKGSVSSLLGQFVKQGQMARDHNGKYIPLVAAYTPLKSTKKFRAEGKRTNKIVSKPKAQPKLKVVPKSEGIAALRVDTINKPVVTQWDAETIINNIGLKQARALYDELKTIFGG